MSELEGIVTYTFLWHSQPDACKHCAAVPKIITGQDLFASVLTNPVNGEPIWDLNADRSLMHGGSGTCRCQLTVRVEFDWSKADWWQDIMAMEIKQ